MAFSRRLQPRLRQTAAFLFVAAMLLGAAPGGQKDTASLAGQLLVAAPDMGDPRFVHAVILLIRQDDTGAFGIVLNHPIEQRSVASLLEAAGDRNPGLPGTIEVYAGGPV